MTGNKNMLTNIQNYSNKYVMFGDGGKGKVKGVGTLKVPGMPVLHDV